MCERCGNPACKGSENLVQVLASMKDSEILSLLMEMLAEMRQEVGKEHPAYKKVLIAQALADEAGIRFASLAVRSAFGMPTRLAPPVSLLGSALGGLAGALYQRDVTPRRAARGKGPKGPVQRRFGPPRRKDS